eukprot:757303-Pyramimonas_sp.AAC.1
MLLSAGVFVSHGPRLFDPTVGACVLHGSISWAPRAAEIRPLTAARSRQRGSCAPGSSGRRRRRGTGRG